MKRLFVAMLALGISLGVSAQKKEEIIKTGLNFGAVPALGLDADKGILYGAILNVYNYSDGSYYPNYKSKLYLEASAATKGSQLYTVTYDDRYFMPGIRWSSAFSAAIDKAMDFYGFNGYSSWIDQARLAAGKENKKGPQDPAQFLYTPFYKYDRIMVLAKTDFIGRISDRLQWEAGYHFMWYRQQPINRESINKGKPEYNVFPATQPTLFELYRQWGIISDDEADGGIVSSLRLGMAYDSRDKEGAPSRGIWAEGHLISAPKFLGSSIPFTRYSLTLRQYFPVVPQDVLTFAYRLNYEGTIGPNCPYYALPFMTVMGENFDKDGMGGYRTVRGILRDRVVGLDVMAYNAELRWRFTRFSLGWQNIALGMNLFSDGTMVTRGRDLSYNGSGSAPAAYSSYMAAGRERDRLHVTVGAGFRFIMNENFIVAFDYGTPVTHLMKKTDPLYNQDGTGAFYINTGYLF